MNANDLRPPHALCLGYGGQFIYVIPDLDLVLVTTEDTGPGGRGGAINSRRFVARDLIPSVVE